MSEVSIKVNIAGRTYPLTVSALEETHIRKAEELIAESVDTFQRNYAVKDKQDLLAMTALQVTARGLAQQQPKVEKVVETIEVTKEVVVDLTPELLALEQELDRLLS